MRTFVMLSLLAWTSSANASEPMTRIRTLAIPVPSPPRVDAAPTTPTVLFLNRAAATMTGGQDDSAHDVSSVVQQQGRASAMIPAFAGTDADWQTLVSCLRDMYKRWNVVVTDQRPSQPGYVQGHFGGNGSELGFPTGVGGVAPIDSFQCNNIPNAIVYVFTDIYMGFVQGMCEAGAQEIAHSFSLDHEYLCQDPMTYRQGCGAKTFQDVDAMCGTNGPAACICSRPTQNSVKLLTERLGPAVADSMPPTVSITSPADGAMLDGKAWSIVAMATDNIGVTKVELHIDDGSAHVSVCGDNTLPCTTSAGASTWQLPAGSGMRTFSVWAYDNAGNVGKSASRMVTLAQSGGMPDGGAGSDGGANGGGGDSGNGGNGTRGGNAGGCSFAASATNSAAFAWPMLVATLALLRRRRRSE